jgi:tRNA(Ile)-lysidine synthetase-like protein
MVIRDFVTEFLAHDEWWFANSPSIDKMLWEKYYGTEDCERFLEIASVLNYTADVDTIIYLDQFGRHLLRMGIITKVSFDMVYISILARAITVNLENLEINKKMFVLLAIRHSRNLDIIKTYVVPHIGVCEKMNRFRKATIEVIGQLSVPEIAFPRKSYYKNGVNFLSTEFTPTQEEINRFILDEPLNLPKVFIKEIPIPRENYMISLSGGVDSTILVMLAKNDPYFKGCVHINYTNRNTSDEEEEYVRRICEDVNVPLYVRRIDEVNRVHGEGSNADRAFYEKYTRGVRFSTYTHAIAEVEATCVLLGHNLCDVEENIITNTIDGTHYENLKGMTYESYENNIKIIRPFINIPKKILITLANENRIPYVWNSTPPWSRRGQIRNKIDTIDPNLISGIIGLSEEMSNLYKFLYATLDSLEYKNLSTKEVQVNGNFPDIEAAWKIILQKVCGMMKIPYVSKKSIANFQRTYKNKNASTYIMSEHLVGYKVSQTSITFTIPSSNI